MAKAVGFSESAARRIGNAVRTVERGSRDQSAIRFRQPGGGDGSSSVRVARWPATASVWLRGTAENCNLCDASGNELDPPQTVSVMNRLTPLGGFAAADFAWLDEFSRVVIAEDDSTGQWVLCGYDPTLIQGFKTNAAQVLAHDSGAAATGLMKWVDVTEC